MYKIKKNVPIPAIIRKGGCGKPKYPWNDMEVGDSFYAPDASMRKNGNFNSVVHYANKLYTPKKFIQRTVIDENGNKVLGVWRVE